MSWFPSLQIISLQALHQQWSKPAATCRYEIAHNCQNILQVDVLCPGMLQAIVSDKSSTVQPKKKLIIINQVWVTIQI